MMLHVLPHRTIPNGQRTRPKDTRINSLSLVLFPCNKSWCNNTNGLHSSTRVAWREWWTWTYHREANSIVVPIDDPVALKRELCVVWFTLFCKKHKRDQLLVWQMLRVRTGSIDLCLCLLASQPREILISWINCWFEMWWWIVHRHCSTSNQLPHIYIYYSKLDGQNNNKNCRIVICHCHSDDLDRLCIWKCCWTFNCVSLVSSNTSVWAHRTHVFVGLQ